MKKNNFVVIGN